MSNNQKRNNLSVSFDGFRGIDCRRNHTGETVASDVVNFRIRSDGSLEKRNGYRLLTDMEGVIRAFHSEAANGSHRAYLLVGSTVFLLDLSTGEKNAVGTVGTESGGACFFSYDGELYLSDSRTLYHCQESALLPVIGYVPLIGKDWRNDVVGETYEPRNLLNRHARISYVIGSPASIFLCTGYPVESVQAVYVNGISISAERYSIDTNFNTVNVTELATGDRVELHFTYAEHLDAERLSEFLSCQNAVLFGTAANNRLFFWGGNQPCSIFCSSHVTHAATAESQKHFPDSNGLYIPAGYEFRVGDGRYPIRGAVRHHDRLLLFTENDAWAASADTSGLEDFPTVNINSEVGCASDKGVALAESTPVTLGYHAVRQWESEGASADKYQAISLSLPIDERLSKESLRRSGLFFHRARRELWLHDPLTGIVWICNVGSGFWYRFTGIYADRLFEVGGEVGFLRGQRVYRFDPSATRDYDTEADGTDICAEYESGLLDFGTERLKNLSHFVLWEDRSGGTLTLTVSGNGIAPRSCTVSGGSSHAVLKKRLPTGRFRYASVRLSATGESGRVIHRLTLYTR